MSDVIYSTFSGSHLITAANFCMNGKLAVAGTYDGRCIFYETEVKPHPHWKLCIFYFFVRFSAFEVSHSNTCQVETREK